MAVFKFKVKDFSIVSVYIGSRLQGGPQYGYRIYYNAPDGRTKRLNKTCYTKESARKHIRATVKALNAICNQHAEKQDKERE